jgi:hypothetical protein
MATKKAADEYRDLLLYAKYAISRAFSFKGVSLEVSEEGLEELKEEINGCLEAIRDDRRNAK